MSLPSFSVRRGVTVGMFFMGLLLLSLMALERLRIDMLPEIDFPSITVTTAYEGADPETVETTITRRIEGIVAIAEDLKEIESDSREGLSRVRLKFNWGSNLEAAANDVRERLDIVKPFLPEEADVPRIFKFNLAQSPIMWIGVSAKESYPRLYTILDRQVIEALKRVQGVGNAWIQGAPRRQINVWVDRHRIEAYGVSLTEVVQALRAGNFTGRAGDLSLGLDRFLLRAPGEFRNIDDIRQVVVGLREAGKGGRRNLFTSEGTVSPEIVRVADIAAVEDGYVDQDDRVRLDGSPGVGLVIQKRSGANTVEVAEGVKEKLPEIFASLPADLGYSVVRDGSEEIKRNLSNLLNTVYIGGALVVIITFLFLRRLATSLIVLITIPFSLVASFLFLYLMGYTINLISLSSLAIAIGMVVDNAIVVTDNIQRRRQERHESWRDAAVNGAQTVALAVSASTFTTIVIFLPVIFLGGIVGVLFKQLAFCITLVLLLSLVLSITLTPLMASRLGAWIERGKDAGRRGVEWTVLLEDRYAALLGRALDHPWRMVLGAGVLFGGTMFLLKGLKTDFFPEGDEASINLSFSLPEGTDIDTTDRVMGEIEKIVDQMVPEKIVTLSAAGRPPAGVRGFGDADLNRGRLLVRLPPLENRERHLTDINSLLREQVGKLPGVRRTNFSSGGIGHFINQDESVTVEVFGFELAELDRVAREVSSVMETTPGLGDVRLGRESGVPQMLIEIDRVKAGMLGVPIRTAAESLEAAFAGKVATVFREIGEEYDVRVRFRPEERQKLDTVGGLRVRALTGKDIPLATLANLRADTSPLVISRKDQSRMVAVSANPTGKNFGGIVRDLEERLKKIPLPEGMLLRMGGSVKEQKESFGYLRLALLLSLALTYMVMASQFESFKTPFVIMFTIPLALMGIVWAFRVFDIALAVPSFIGMIMVVGVAVNNGIVFLDFTRQLMDEGRPAREALVEAGRTRLRPILMTTLTTLGGMMPMAVMRVQGSEFWRPLAIAVISGLGVSMLLTLFLIPSIFLLLSRKRA